MFQHLWAFRRASRGRTFGNEIADSIPIQRRLFHSAVEEGGLGMHLILLADLKDERMSVVEARKFALPFLIDGLMILEQRFGPQQMIIDAKPILKTLHSEEE